jgi:hypothetical protein
MTNWTAIGQSALVTGTAAGLTSAAVLALLSTAEGHGALQPTNATSHWLHGEEAAECAGLDASHTLVGYATHHASAVFWALPFELWLASRPSRSTAGLLGRAGVMAGIAAAVDYGLTPKRLTPGWELVISRRSMVATYAAMAMGLAAGAMLARRWMGGGSTQVRIDRAGSPAEDRWSS